MNTSALPSAPRARPRAALEVLAVFLRLGLTSFGGPIAHLGYFRREFVVRRNWLDDQRYSDLVGVCQFLPGPTSSQVGFSIGLLRAGWLGALAAWCGFTLPSVLLLLGFAVLAPHLSGGLGDGLVHGLKLVAVAVVAQAVWDMARRLCPDRRRAAIALCAMAVIGVLTGNVYAQLIAIVVGALLGLALCRAATPSSSSSSAALDRSRHEQPAPDARLRISRAAGVIALLMFCVLLLVLPAFSRSHDSQALKLFDAFYRSGALVFGGGHVVLPLLQQQTVATGWVASNDFLAGYGAAQAVPGPLFTFAAYLGWMSTLQPHLWTGALIATVAIFLPGMLLVIAALPWWQSLRARPAVAALLAGVNAAVVGLLAMALYSPVWTSAVHTPIDFAVAALGFVLLVRWNAPPLAIVALCVATGVAATAL
ncbi:chromate efflux transporter [Paraburkholderia sp. SOS3]|jgi:chromate transporter|uniref:chromate efflux transporter n=1 Tax=Paraburkholderia sp. SOS3 TaxID=1926494 RepID=UPI0009476CF2|nr:chromate efflux transporter [Paraburkholderia sp. SOS3]APR39599.1 chromate ion family chromate transporter [Paraburkholderia sp. SOS3]